MHYELCIKGSQRGKDSQRRKITGRVLDTSGEPVDGATVLVKDSNNGTITDIDGNYTLNDVPENAEITISYVGFTPHTFKATDRNLAKVTLQEDSKVLNEIVVVGYGTQRKKLITGSTVQLSGDELTNLSASNPIEAMQISTPGLQVTQNGGNPDAGYKFFIRGIGTLGNSAPLIIVDGLVGADLNSISPSDIESIDVLKDAASSAIYGSRAANGVIIVTTKKGKEGKTQITYDGYYGFQDVPNVLHAADAKTYMQMLNEASDYEGTPRYDYAALVPNFADIESGKFKGTDRVEESMNKNAPVTNHAANISGGNPMSTYSIGFSYLYQEGTFGEPKPLKILSLYRPCKFRPCTYQN